MNLTALMMTWVNLAALIKAVSMTWVNLTALMHEDDENVMSELTSANEDVGDLNDNANENGSH